MIALDISPVRLALAKHNARIYGVDDRIDFILMDYIAFARTYLARPVERRTIDVIFLSPPWGGLSYLTMSPQKEKSELEAVQQLEYSLEDIVPISGDKLFQLSRRITANIAFFLPRNVNLTEISDLTKSETRKNSNHDLVLTQRVIPNEEHIEVEEEYMSGKLKAVTCYFGSLVAGQEDMF